MFGECGTGVWEGTYPNISVNEEDLGLYQG